jgi:putative membrane-bound dehydrogenase-like protein
MIRSLRLTATVAAFAASLVSSKAADTPSEKPAAKPKPKPVEHRFGPESAAEDVKKLVVAQGLEATLFAAEPMMVNPCDMDVDERGRVWITEGANYRKWSNPPLRPEGDRIVILEDTDGDGKADKQTVFYQGKDVNSALGICVLGNKVIVSSAPNVFVFTDEDGDGKADKKELLFTGIKGVQHDHAVHAFVFGPDGKLYFNMGNAGEDIRDKDGKPITDMEGNVVNATAKPYRQGLVFRCNMDGSEFEVLGHNFRNNYEVCVDSFGTLWQSDNDDDGNRGVRINYVMEHGNFGYTDEMTGASWGTAWGKAKAKGVPDEERPYYHWYQYDPGVVPNLLQTGNGSPTGICVYEGDLLPAVFRNQIIHCDAGPKVVRAYPVKNEGAGYSATISNLLTSPDNWFRPSDVCVAPDGSVLVADWNDAGVGGHNMADRELDKMTGRVYRIAPPGAKYAAPSLDLKTAAGCMAALQSPNQAARYLAWTALNRMQANGEKESDCGSRKTPGCERGLSNSSPGSREVKKSMSKWL